MKNMKFYYVKTVLICWKTYISIFILIIMCTLDFNPNRKLTLCQSTTDLSTQIMYHLLVPNVVRKACISNMYICSLIGFNSYFVLYLMCCFGNNPLYMDFKPIKILFCANVSSVFKVSLFNRKYRLTMQKCRNGSSYYFFIYKNATKI